MQSTTTRDRNLKLFNSMGRAKVEFKPRKNGEVKIFTCGPSTYRRPHIGNYRSFLYEDILVRYLMYRGYSVKRTINFTDVEDKAIVEAEHKGKKVSEITGEVHKHFFRETDLLGIILPDEIPRSSTSVDQAVKIIKKLVKDGAAYWHEGNVYFDPLKFDGFGKLYGLDMSNWPKKKVRFKRDTYNGRRWNRGDFILWHGHDEKKDSSDYWETEIGKGRPAWNIQDPAMILQQIGTQVDINCGGIDNIFRHHDYNIAVMESYSGKPYANYYLHGEHLIVDGKPMSKSIGNILYPDDLVDQGYEHKHLRFFLIYTYYRKKLNFTDRNFQKTSKILDDFRNRAGAIMDGAAKNGVTSNSIESLIKKIPGIFEEQMDDDLNVGKAFDAVYAHLGVIAGQLESSPLSKTLASSLKEQLEKIDTVFGVIF